MDEQQIFKNLETIFGRVFGAETNITRATTIDDLEQWDSLTHMQLINEIELFFGISFSLDEVIAIDGVNNLVQLIHRKLG
jgi:acyl carrier protein